MTPRSLERDLIGYGSNPPNPRWPGGARLALNFVLNYEEGSEYSMMDGDGVSDAALAEMASVAVPRGERDLAAESMFEYGSRVGFWRLHRIFQERGLPMTVFACALALERNPPAAQAIKAAGYDICCHGWRWVEHFKLDEATSASISAERSRASSEQSGSVRLAGIAATGRASTRDGWSWRRAAFSTTATATRTSFPIM